MNICLFSSEEIEFPKPFLSFDDKRGEHILKVLHKTQGDSFTAGIIGGASGTAVITKVDNSEKKIFFEFKAEGDGKPLNPLKMIVGFPRPIQLRRLLRDVAALGVSELHLTGTELGEKSYMQSDLAQPEKAHELLLEGTVQAGSTHVPKVFIHSSLKECLNEIKGAGSLDGARSQDGARSLDGVRSLSLSKGPAKKCSKTLLCLDNINPVCSVSDAMETLRHRERHCNAGQKQSGGLFLASLRAAVRRRAQGPQMEGCEIIAAIGSERGWTDNERRLLEQAGFVRCGMGERIMRTETAVTVAGAIILNSMGRLSGQARQ